MRSWNPGGSFGNVKSIKFAFFSTFPKFYFRFTSNRFFLAFWIILRHPCFKKNDFFFANKKFSEAELSFAKPDLARYSKLYPSKRRTLFIDYAPAVMSSIGVLSFAFVPSGIVMYVADSSSCFFEVVLVVVFLVDADFRLLPREGFFTGIF